MGISVCWLKIQFWASKGSGLTDTFHKLELNLFVPLIEQAQEGVKNDT